MKQNKGFDEPVIGDNEVKTLRRVLGETTEKINSLLNRIINLENRVKTLES